MTEALDPAPRIAVLSEVVRNQIAAGEVIERPAAVVRELLDNALDADAGQIHVELEEGGMRLVRVTDDGIGMGTADLELSFEAHATSKLASPEDLDHIASLGFRGEALASMASVARCKIRSRPHGAATGAEITEEGGRRGPITPTGMPPGTIVEVRDLFYNTPARRRFLKREQTELSRCMDVIQRVALAHPADEDGGEGGVGIVVEHGGRRVFDIERSMDLRARIRRVFGAELASELERVEARKGSTRVFGYVAPPRFARRDTRRQMWFLNGRPLRDKVLIRVLKDSYRGVLVDGPQPVAFLHLWLAPEEVDVNVHPAKSEVRLRDERSMFGFLVHSIREAVMRTNMATPGETMLERLRRREGKFQQKETFADPGPLRGAGETPVPSADWIPRPGADASGGRAGTAAGGVEAPSYEVREVVGSGSTTVPTGSGEASVAADGDTWRAVDDLRGPYLQIANTYLVRALPDGFEIIDQHALHERLTFEEISREVREGAVEVQRFLTPDLIELSAADVGLIAQHRDALAAVGIELDAFGDTTIAVQGLPARIKRPDTEGIVRDIVDVIARTGKAPDAEHVMEEVLQRASCRSSIMAGDALDQSSIRALLERARASGADQTCPHARPTRVRFGLKDLEKAFHRS